MPSLLLAVATATLSAPAQAATVSEQIRPDQLSLSETRATGHVDFLADGLHVWTEGNTSTDKAAGYFAMSGPLPDSGSLEWFGTTPAPGAQIIFDVDGITGNGNDYNLLVGESVYGDNWWLTPSSSDDAKAADPSGASNGGNGSEWFGTLAEWKAALPDASVQAGGFSLGSGIKGDGVLHAMTYGGTTYTFTSIETADVTADFKAVAGKRFARLVMKSDALEPGTTVGEKVRWTVFVDGRRVARFVEGPAERDVWKTWFPRHTGVHRVVLTKDGVPVFRKAFRTGRR